MSRRGRPARIFAILGGRGGAILFGAFFAFASSTARAQLTSSPSAVEASAGPGASVPSPPPLDIPYIQYGVAFTTEFVADAGRMCQAASAVGAPCILGSGGGIVARVGRRSAGPWYFGAAYELSKQDPSNLYRFATLQQLRAEARYYLETGRDVYPYVAAGSGAATYGDEWSVDTYGPVETLGVGLEAQVSRRTVVGLALSYRLLVLNDFYTGNAYAAGASFVQVVGLDLFLEERSPIVSALPHQ
jgi:hypothetical protein